MKFITFTLCAVLSFSVYSNQCDNGEDIPLCDQVSQVILTDKPTRCLIGGNQDHWIRGVTFYPGKHMTSGQTVPGPRYRLRCTYCIPPSKNKLKIEISPGQFACKIGSNCSNRQGLQITKTQSGMTATPPKGYSVSYGGIEIISNYQGPPFVPSGAYSNIYLSCKANELQ